MTNLNFLNSNQLEAVKTTEGPVRIVAGPGSGKTNVAVYRAAYLVNECGIDPSTILMVTFTNNAAKEIKRRLEKLIGFKSAYIMIYTYHGFGVKALKEDIEKFFFSGDFQILDLNGQKSILADIYQKHGLKLDYASFEFFFHKIAKIKRSRTYVAGMWNTENVQILDEIKSFDDEIIEEYLQRQKQLSALDFNDLLYFTIELFIHHPKVLAKWQNKINYIMVDEVQDTTSPKCSSSICLQKVTTICLSSATSIRIFSSGAVLM